MLGNVKTIQCSVEQRIRMLRVVIFKYLLLVLDVVIFLRVLIALPMVSHKSHDSIKFYIRRSHVKLIIS